MVGRAVCPAASFFNHSCPGRDKAKGAGATGGPRRRTRQSGLAWPAPVSPTASGWSSAQTSSPSAPW